MINSKILKKKIIKQSKNSLDDNAIIGLINSLNNLELDNNANNNEIVNEDVDEINNKLIEENNENDNEEEISLNFDSINKGNIINEIEDNNSFKKSDLYTRILEYKRFENFNEIINEMKIKKVNYKRFNMVDEHDLDLVNVRLNQNEKNK